MSGGPTTGRSGRISGADRRAAEAIADTLRSTALGEPGLRHVADPLRALLRAQLACGYGIEEAGGRLAVARVATSAGASARFSGMLAALAGQSPRGWGGMHYDARRPEPRQRNRVLPHLDGNGTRAAVRRYLERFPATRDAWERAGLVCDQVRVLVCDGPSLLSWVGAFRPDAFTDRESRLLQALVPALRDRLRLERQLGDVPLALAALPAVLEGIGAPAFVAGSSGEVALANASALALLERGRGVVRAALSAEIAARGPNRYTVTRLSLPGCPAWFLCVERERPPDPGPRAAAFAARHDLTDRQAEVVALAVRGLANKTIAAHLRCAEATVEMHLTVVFGRTQAASRAELVAQFWKGSW